MARYEKTLKAIFADPAPANIKWADIESMLRHLGSEITEGNGSRVRVRLNGIRATFHRPHPNPQANRPLVRSVRTLLINAGQSPQD